MDKIEKIRRKVKELYDELEDHNYYLDNSEQALGYGLALNDIEKFLDNLSEEPDKSLEEEIRKYLSDRWKFGCCTPVTPVVLPNYTTVDLKKCANHFAQWQREQMLKDAMEGVVCYGSKGAYIETDFLGEYDTDVYGNPGDKVRIVVLKEEEK